MSTTQIKVLLVEDEKRDVRLIQAMLGAVTDVAFEVECAERLSTALKRLAQGTIDVVLLDLSLPDSRGLETFLRVKKQAPAVPVVVMTGLDDEAVGIEAVQKGAQDYLIKGQVDQGLLGRSLRYAIERHLAELQSRRSEERLQALLENTSDGTIILDKDMTVTYASPPAVKLLGAGSDGLVGMVGLEPVHPEDAPRLTETMQALLKRPGGKMSVECRYRHEDGTWHNLEATGKNLLDNPAVQGIVVNFRDITEYKSNEEILRRRTQISETASLISSRLVGVYDLDHAINESLRDLGNFSGASRSYVFLFAKDKATVSNTHEWCAQGVAPKKASFENISSVNFAWLMAKLAQQEYVLIDDVSKLPREVKADRKVLESRGVESVLLLPLIVGEKLAGFMGLDNILEGGAWVDGDVALPRMAAQVISLALDRGRAEEVSTRSDQYLHAVLDHVSDAIVVLNADGTIRYHNPAAPLMSGLAEGGELTGKNLFGIVHPDDALKIMQLSTELLQKPGVTMSMECRFHRNDGSWGYLDASGANYLQDPVINGVVITISDVTERKRAEEAVRESEEKYRDVVERANDGIIIVQGTRIQYANHRVAEIVGFGPEEVLGTSMANYAHPDELPKVMDRYKRRLAGEDMPQIYETVLMHRDGHKVDVELNAGAITYQGKPADLVIIRDISQRKKAEEALLEAERRYRAIFDNPVNMVNICDENGIFLDANDAALKRLGYTRDDLGKVGFRDLIHPEDLPRVFQELSGVMTKGYMECTLQMRMISKTGEVVWLETYGSRIEQDDEHFRGLAIGREITEAKRAEEALRRSEEKLKDLVDKLRLSQEALSTPVVQLWENVLALPLIGMVDDRRAQHVMEVLLRNIVRTQSELVILDVTGVTAMDSQVASYVMQTVRSASLLGARCVLTGIQPEVAQAVVGLGLDMEKVVIKKDMREGLRWALQAMGYQLRNGHSSGS